MRRSKLPWVLSLHDSNEVADILNLSVRTITRHARELGGTKKGRLWRFLPEDIERARREDIFNKGPGRPRERA